MLSWRHGRHAPGGSRSWLPVAPRGLGKFLLRALGKVNGEWSLMGIGHNLLNLFRFDQRRPTWLQPLEDEPPTPSLLGWVRG
jgi:hypothetical protein